MGRSWQELFFTGDGATQTSSRKDAGLDQDEEGFFRRLRKNLVKSREALTGELRATVYRSLDEATWERLEESLILADVGARTTAEIVGRLEREAELGKISGGAELAKRLEAEVAAALDLDGARIDISAHPSAIVVVGVNGTGKTTTIGKIAWHLQRELGKSVLLAAADTYRAAATEQLAIWAERAGCQIVKGQRGSDPAAVAYDSIEAARARDVDVVICDTAGRLHTEVNLIAELAKIVRVIGKQLPGAPHETLLVVDATTGQNGLGQAGLFKEAIDVSGICLTKLDGTAKGGIALAVASELAIPIKLIGIGESLEDLRPFDPGDFARALIIP